MAKRKAVEPAQSAEPRRSTRRKTTDVVEEKTATEPATKTAKTTAAKEEPLTKAEPAKTAKAKAGPKPKLPKTSKTPTSPATPKTKATTAAAAAPPDTDRQYWLLKAEPETRLENGIDVRFSIDDLAAKTEPEPWDGIRNYAARNNLRAMKKGDLAFFYHSNCKTPGIVGTMEIVQEHSPDWTAHDPKTAYYDASSKPADPKWSVVHVVFHSKFKQQISLPELRAMGSGDGPLANMQLLKQSRLSVSKVSAAEWAHLMGVVAERGGEL